MMRLAIVVQRCHEDVVGGSEALAWQYARLLSLRFDVEVLTSTAMDHTTWNNVLPAGRAVRGGIAIRRFPVAITRQAYWDGLYQRLVADADVIGEWREALQDEFIRFQGPYCPALDAWLREHGNDYAAVMFCTYLYPTTYFAIRAVAPRKAILVPTLHDELPAYLPVFARLYSSYPQRIWLTTEEQRTSARIWGFDQGAVLGMAVEHAESTHAETRERPYLLYCGRIEAGKGAAELLCAYERLPSRGRVSLVLTGADNLGLPDSPDVEYLGFVDTQRKLALMAGAAGFVQPSPHESFSIVTLEAMAQRTPVLVNGRCEVTRGHVERSAGGFHYGSIDELVERMEQLCKLADPERARLGGAGRDYVLANYHEERIRERLIDYVVRVIAGAPPQD
jgi:glycosyltransferase involved in cell wall biosynthesis